MRVSDLVRWKAANLEQEQRDPVEGTRAEINRLFDDFLRDFRSMQQGGPLNAFNPSMNLSETEQTIEATIELPGLDENDIDVSLGPEGLTIKGEKRTEQEDEGTNYVRRERSYGYFSRTVPLPSQSIDRDKVEASFEKGVLRVTIPKKEAEPDSRRRIEVRTE